MVSVTWVLLVPVAPELEAVDPAVAEGDVAPIVLAVEERAPAGSVKDLEEEGFLAGLGQSRQQ